LNNLNGKIPLEIGNLTQIKKFKLGHDKGLSGEIPESVINLSQLEVFVICNCSIYGKITNKICDCSNLSSLQLWENNLTGPIPPEIGNLNSLKFLDLYDNQLTGTIPPELGNCTNLRELHLNNNNLSGGLPAEIASINGLNSFNVSNNDLSGPVPDEFAYQISYWFFYINDNNFDYLPPFNNWYLLSGLKVENNKLTFEHLESHAQAGYMWFDYSPQANMLEEIDTTLVPGSNYCIYSGTGGEFTNYKWYKNNELIFESPEADTLFLENITYSDTGVYICHAQNSLLNLLNLHRNLVHITIDTGTNIAVINNLQKYIAIYPNPASEEICIEIPDLPGPVEIRIFDMGGKCMMEQPYSRINNSPFVTDIKVLKTGIYLLQVKTENSNFATKLIINNRGESQ
jgi:Leucine-rich repeat (LRR) protein